MDSLDLTFVRCPSCRSLVPAISTRCRMCGASLEASAGSDSLTGTASSAGTGVAEKSTDKSTEKSSVNSSANNSALQTKSDASDNDRSGAIKFDDGVALGEQASDDPLSAYVEELTASVSAVHPESEDVETISELESTSRTTTSPIAVDSAVDDLAAAQAMADIEALDASSTGTARVSGLTANGSHTAGVKLRASAPSPIESSIDSKGAAASGSKTNVPRLDFGSRGGSSSAEARPAADARASESRPFEARRGGNERRYQQPVATGAVNQKENQSNNNRRGDMKGSEARVGDVKGVEGRGQVDARYQGGNSGSNALARNPAVSPASVTSVTRSRETPVFGSGRLVGWLVSYADTRGASLELREGKFFVTAKSIKENDLVLDERSVSTPHALVVCGRDGGLTVQDLMSERGVFVRRRGSNQYRQEEEATLVDHGDWLRFGDLEFLVVLIPASME